ncbi:MAG: peptidoglycan DD-metalloendopeptidase family protein, partial [Alphaproteobacteria bacterium]|nr:peptidoglycan DD-metalloendopeptidase family protein [Alphaproteobacteria bacterium]
LEEKKSNLSKIISALDKQRKDIDIDLHKKKELITDATAYTLYLANNPNFDTENMHSYIMTSAVLTGIAQNYDTKIREATKQLDKLDKLHSERLVEKEKLDKIVQKYSVEKNKLDKLLKTRSAQNEQLKKKQIEIQNNLRELSARAKSISELSAGVGSSEMSADSKFSIRKLNPPVSGKLVVKYGEKTAFGLKSDGWRIKTRTEALVSAPADGIIKYADTFKGYGKIVIISHKNGYNTIITNLGTINAFIGQEVLAGEPLGRVHPQKSEMYLEVRRGGNLVDPAKLFKEP